MKILSVIAVVVLLFIFSFFTERPEPREKLPEPTASTPEEIDEEPEFHVDVMPLDFSSEEEFIEYALGVQNERADLFSVYSEEEFYILETSSRYYRLKTSPEEANLHQITVVPGYEVTVSYYVQKSDADDFGLITIQYSPYYTFNIATRHWPSPFPDEAYIREIDGSTYYIAKWSSGMSLLWVVEWYNEEGCHMMAQFPLRFTADEVLAYVSDLERVEIG